MAAQNFPGTLAVACSMADAVLPHVVSRVLPGVDVLFLDTGYHFAETMAPATPSPPPWTSPSSTWLLS